MNRVVIELDFDGRLDAEYSFIDLANLVPATPNPPKRIIHGGFVRRIPVALHQCEITAVECTIKLCKGANRLLRIVAIFVPCYGGQDWLDQEISCLCCFSKYRRPKATGFTTVWAS